MKAFVKKISEFILAISIAASIVLVAIGCAIIAVPELLPTILIYGIGIGCVLLGVTLILSFLRSAAENSTRKIEQ